MDWPTQKIETQQWRCGFCDREVASNAGWEGTVWSSNAGRNVPNGYVAVCPRCTMPSIVGRSGATVPASTFGESVEHLPDDVGALYREARNAVGSGSSNCAALACRKILMHVAVEKGAQENQTFAHYVDYLCDNGHVPSGAKDWIDEVRQHGNAANHEIDLMDTAEAENMVEFTAMMLKVVYEFPARAAEAKTAREARRK